MKKRKNIRVFNIVSFLLAISLFTFSGITAFAVEEEPASVENAQTEGGVGENVELSNIQSNDLKAAFIEVQGYSVESGLLEAGSDLDVTITLHNISSSVSADGVVMTINNSTGYVFPRYGSDNQFYVGKILPDESKDIVIPLTVSSNFSGDNIDITCELNYASESNLVHNKSSMVITSAAGKSIIVKNVDISNTATLNGKSLLSITYNNISLNNITDAKLVIDGNVSEECKNINLDTVYAGKNYSKDYNVVFTEKGNQKIVLKLTYTDSEGGLVETDLGTYTVTVNNKDTSARIKTTPNITLIIAGRVIAAIAIIIAIGITIVRYNKK